MRSETPAEEEYESYYRPVESDDLAQHYQTLGLSPGASQQEIRRAFKEVVFVQ